MYNTYHELVNTNMSFAFKVTDYEKKERESSVLYVQKFYLLRLSQRMKIFYDFYKNIKKKLFKKVYKFS